MSNVRTRFAPSPTGYMHIGGMRTALFNWLWARHNGGQFILRIDDTDQERNLSEALGPILQAFKWLGLDWDEGPEVGGEYGPYFQSERNDLYRAAVDQLLTEGNAYRCYVRTDEIPSGRDEKLEFMRQRPSLKLSQSELDQYEAEGRPSVVRLKVPHDQIVKIEDAVRGHVEFDTNLMIDPVILRANGTPLYNLATVIDDAQMQITHVIRAEEHLSNTPIQVLIYQALGYDLPQFAHIPFVAAPGGKEKLSKRKLEKYRKSPQFKKMFDKAESVFPRIGLENAGGLDPVMVEYYEKIGYLPEAILNALARLGWSLDDKTENMSLDKIIENFTLDRIVKSAAGLDPDKLLSFQSHWMNQLSLDEKVERCSPFLENAGLVQDASVPEIKQRISQVILGMEDRLKVASDILDFDEFFVADDQLEYDPKAFKKRIQKSAEAVILLGKLKDQLAKADDFGAGALDKLLHDFVDAEEIGMGQIIHALRVSVSGKGTGIGMFDCLAILGRASCVRRIERAIALAQGT
ncbi:MAG: glutamate--tRNA ligase [Planctomycetes bacterium]|nr:glutamate--tRNA ligase [Planctomycetota bacterium]MCH9727809.1 glutamate--tRNA ligase [Planctomycetota bacterium]MCH9779372.1 glutamate--tRNA ligase [Planctomycetota bacterium]MCH9789459.1 glutamate--tRNA ligase [Planctomycetota bacterium]